MTIQKAAYADLAQVSALAQQLWPNHSRAELAAEFEPLLASADAAVFLALDGETPVGFAQCQLRRDYVEGTQTSPVGYLEGIFVAEPHRGNGIAKKLLAACEAWAKSRGCREFASDCQLTNGQSLAFHLRMGFREANRIICFAKEL